MRKTGTTILLAVLALTATVVQAQVYDASEIGKVKVGGRVNMDASWYYDQPHFNMGDGSTFSELRVRFNTILSTRSDLRAEVDFAFGSVVPRDVAYRYFVSKDLTFQLGNFREPFSPAAYASSVESFFIAIPTPGQAFSCGRNLGAGARYVKKNFWAEAGFFGQDLLDQVKGSKGVAFTGRVIFRPINESGKLIQFGLANTIRRADAISVSKDANGNDIELRAITYGSRAETNVDRNQILYVRNPYAKYQDKLGAEFLGIWNKFSLQGEYINSFVTAKQGYKDQHYYGAYAQAVYQILGKGLAYNDNDAIGTKSAVGGLNLALRYSYTSLNDSKGYYNNGAFTDFPNGTVANGSFNGGELKGFSASLTYFPTKSLAFTVEYDRGSLSNISLDNGRFQLLQAQAIVLF